MNQNWWKILVAIIGASGYIIAAYIAAHCSACQPVNPSDDFDLRINSPSGCQDSGLYIPVSGTSSGKLPDDMFVWIMVGPRDALGKWYPQGADHISFIDTGDWITEARIDGDKGKKFDIRAVLVDLGTDEKYREWFTEGNKTGNYQGLRMPDNARTLDQVTVVRA